MSERPVLSPDRLAAAQAMFSRRLLIEDANGRVRFIDVEPGEGGAITQAAVDAACAALEAGGGAYLDEEDPESPARRAWNDLMVISGGSPR